MMAVSPKHIIVIGTGLGGLLTGAFLAAHGHQVVFLEKLDIIGGRFTHIDYEGFAVPTGAFHAIPGGQKGPIAACLRAIGISVRMVKPAPSMHVIWQGRSYPLYLPPLPRRDSAIRKAFGLNTKDVRFALRTFGYWLAALAGREYSVADWLRGMSPDDAAVRLFDHLTSFSFGVRAEDAPMIYLLRSLKAQRAGAEGFLCDGNRALVTTLLDFALARGASVHTRTPAARIIVENGQAVGVETVTGERLAADLIISNAGVRRTLDLLGEQAPAEMRVRIAAMQPAYGASHAIRSRRQLQEHASIEMPVDLDYIAGIAPISNICPALCPPGWHFSLAYQVLDHTGDIEPQIAHAHRELRAHLGDDIDIFNTAVYSGEHPAQAIPPVRFQHGARRAPHTMGEIRNLYLAGEDCISYGFAAEMVGHSCLTLFNMLRTL